MKTRIPISFSAAVAGLFLSVASGLSQGNLTPPGAPAPTMKTLDQIEPRTVITNLPVTLTNGGSYYLGASFTQAFTANAITIATNNVTLDLAGFTITQTALNAFSGVRVVAPGANAQLTGIHIRNGSVSGFANGINLMGSTLCIVEDVSAHQCTNGIIVQGNGTAVSISNIIRHNLAGNNNNVGILILDDVTNNANAVIDCDSDDNKAGFDLASINNLIIHCRASSNTTNYMIAADNDMGTTAEPIQNSSTVAGSKGGSFGIGVTDPFSNLSYP